MPSLGHGAVSPQQRAAELLPQSAFGTGEGHGAAGNLPVRGSKQINNSEIRIRQWKMAIVFLWKFLFNNVLAGTAL